MAISYRAGFTNPRCRPAYWSAIAVTAAQNGAEALVPPAGLTKGRAPETSTTVRFVSRSSPEAADGHVELSADAARDGTTVLAEWGRAVLTVPVGSTEAAVAWPYIAAVEQFFSGCVDVLRAELCPDEEV